MDYAKSDAIIMHPLPRVNELAYELDEDERAAYFEQSANAVPTRMALVASLLGLEQLVLTQPPTRKMVSDQESCENPTVLAIMNITWNLKRRRLPELHQFRRVPTVVFSKRETHIN